jgi:Ca2+-dependent lipid-binding protein
LFSTRIIKNDRNPIFEETAVVTIDSATLRARENLSIQLWDSDRASADDVQGSIEIEIFELLRKKNTVSRQSFEVTKSGSQDACGRLEFTIGYYDKLSPSDKFKTDGSNPQIPDDLKDYPEIKGTKATTLSELEELVMRCSPDPEYPSGLLSIQIHEICNLEVRTEGKETIGSREGKKGQDDGGTDEEQGERLPSSYCTL